MKKFKNIVLTKKKSKVEFKDVDGWIFDLKYYVNNKESYSAQVLKTDVAGRIERLQAEGFKKIELNDFINLGESNLPDNSIM